MPRRQVKALPADGDARRCENRISFYRLFTAAVYREQLDEIVAVVFRKDLDMRRIPHEGSDPGEVVRPPAFIPATASLGKALRQVQRTRVHFDERSGIEEILTLEDLLEEMVGEISDEYDDEVREHIRRDGETCGWTGG